MALQPKSWWKWQLEWTAEITRVDKQYKDVRCGGVKKKELRYRDKFDQYERAGGGDRQKEKVEVKIYVG